MKKYGNNIQLRRVSYALSVGILFVEIVSVTAYSISDPHNQMAIIQGPSVPYLHPQYNLVDPYAAYGNPYLNTNWVWTTNEPGNFDAFNGNNHGNLYVTNLANTLGNTSLSNYCLIPLLFRVDTNAVIADVNSFLQSWSDSIGCSTNWFIQYGSFRYETNSPGDVFLGTLGVASQTLPSLRLDVPFGLITTDLEHFGIGWYYGSGPMVGAPYQGNLTRFVLVVPFPFGSVDLSQYRLNITWVATAYSRNTYYCETISSGPYINAGDVYFDGFTGNIGNVYHGTNTVPYLQMTPILTQNQSDWAPISTGVGE